MKKVLLCQRLVQKLKESTKNRMQIDDNHQSTIQSNESCMVMLKELKRCVHAIWSLLPAFCRKPTDVPEIFPKIAKRIGENLYNKELAIYSLAALRNLFKCDHSVQCVVGTFGKNFLPILFNVYTNENENSRIDQDLRYPLYIVITHMIRCMLLLDNNDTKSMEMYHNFFEKLITILKESPGSDFRRIALIEIVDAFLWTPEGLNSAEIEYIYEKIARPLISDSKSPVDQKKGFRLIEPIVQSKSIICEEFRTKHMEAIINLLINLMENDGDDKILRSPSSRAYALRLLNSE
ncbi:hypothetical protein BLA29_007363 [Euroglyphus maynei]|uniref:RRP12 HEAT domain-containing protein n=1 Tax=Euroglyphus maynei TaxID=6958 RepID=A0A1Y3AN47_EURMA|nr:hypothetical protein BLA29_007363 [Euroglyphus maynei]